MKRRNYLSNCYRGLLLFMSLWCFTQSVNADWKQSEFIVDNVCYRKTSTYSSNEVAVTYDWCYINDGSGTTTYTGPYDGNVTIPEFVTYNSVTYKVTSIDAHALEGHSSVTSVSLPNTITSIGVNAFYNCSGLQSITLPQNVTSIGGSAFSGCNSLTSITIPESVTIIGSYAFYGCSGLTSIKVAKGNPVYDSRSDCNVIIETASNTLIAGCINSTIPESVTSIDSYAFSGCSGLTSITIPESVTNIGSHAFSGCSGLTSITINCPIVGSWFSDLTSIKEVTLGKAVINIGSYAFYGCSGLTSVTIPESVTSLGSYAFSGCSGLTSIIIPESVTSIGSYAFNGTAWLSNQPNGLIYAGKIAYKYKGTMPNNTNLVIMDGTRNIASYAFYGCSGLASVTIPESVTSIGSYAFYGCNGLTSISIPGSVISIEGAAFENCSSLTSIIIPESVTNIGSSAFNGTAWYNNHPDGLVYAGKVAYKYKGTMPNNTNIVIKEGTKGVANSAFSNCSGLMSITIPEGVTSLGNQVFSDCSGLTSVTIPESVTSIGSYAFSGCSGLTSVTVGRTTPLTISSNTFSNRANATLYVPAGSKEAYEAADYWKDFKEIVEMMPSEITLADGENYTNDSDEHYDFLHYSRTFSNTNWQAWYVPFDLTLTSDVMEHFAFAKFAGTYTEEDGSFFITVVRMSEGDVVKANTPYCVQAKVADAMNPQVITQADVTLKAAEENSFHVLSAEKKITFRGNYLQRTVTAENQNWYVLSGGQYSRQLPGNTIAPFRCYFTIEDREDNPYSTTPNPSNVKLMVLGEDATGISDMNVDNVNSEQYAGTVYDISGRKVSRQHMSKGLYIINGKKVYVK